MLSRLVTALALLSLAVSPHLPGTLLARAPGVALLLAASALAHRRGAGPAAQGALMAALLHAAAIAPLPWPAPGALAIAAYVAIVRRPAWLRRGAIDRATALGIAASVALPAVGLVAWFALASPDLAPYRMYAALPRWLFVAGVPLFAMVNAAVEEAVWRGAMTTATDDALGAGWRSVVVQAVFFGLWHVNGFPSGASGAALAAGFAFLMGALRKQSRGMLAPWLAHVAADTTIGAILALAL